MHVFIGDIGLCRIVSDCVVVRLAGLEPAAHSLGNCCSIHLSYRRKLNKINYTTCRGVARYALQLALIIYTPALPRLELIMSRA